MVLFPRDFFTSGVSYYKTVSYRFPFHPEFLRSSEKMSASTAAFNRFSPLLIFYTRRVLKIRKTSDRLDCFDGALCRLSSIGFIYQPVCVPRKLHGHHFHLLTPHCWHLGPQQPWVRKQLAAWLLKVSISHHVTLFYPGQVCRFSNKISLYRIHCNSSVLRVLQFWLPRRKTHTF